MHRGCLQDGTDERDDARPEDGFSSASPINQEPCWECGDGSAGVGDGGVERFSCGREVEVVGVGGHHIQTSHQGAVVPKQLSLCQLHILNIRDEELGYMNLRLNRQQTLL